MVVSAGFASDDRTRAAEGEKMHKLGNQPKGTVMAQGRASVAEALREEVADPDQVSTRAIDLHANAHDASHFLLVPKVLVIAKDAAEVGRLLRTSSRTGTPLTLRFGGTSLSGQGVTDSVLVDVRRNFRRGRR